MPTSRPTNTRPSIQPLLTSMTSTLKRDGEPAVVQTLSSMHRVMLSDPQVSPEEKELNRELLLEVAQKLGVSVPILAQGHDVPRALRHQE